MVFLGQFLVFVFMVFPRYVALLELFGVLVRVVSQFHLALPAL